VTTDTLIAKILVVFSIFQYTFFFGSVRQIKLATGQLLGHESIVCRIVSRAEMEFLASKSSLPYIGVWVAL